MNIFKNKGFYVVLVVTIIVVSLSVINVSKDDTSRRVFMIGGAFGLSGQCAEFGEGELKAAQLAIREANKEYESSGVSFELVVEDTECEYKSTFNAINKLIHVNKVSMIIGPTWGDSFQSAVPLINKSKIPTISPSAAMEAIHLQKQPVDYYFSTWFSGNSEMTAIQNQMNKIGHKNVVVVHDQDPFGVLMSEIFNGLAHENGINLVDTYDSVTGTEDYRVILSKISSAKPDAVFMSFIGPDSKVKFLKQAREFGLTLPMYSASDIQNETLLKQFGSYMEGVTYSYPKTSGLYDIYVDRYKSEYGSVPQGPSSANAYDAVKIATASMIQAYDENVPIRDVLTKIKLKGYSSEVLGFNEMHQMQKAESLIKTIKEGKFVEVK
ncbi:MAG: amino acid ABC transporter substrate-binding protein [Candidatus Taylorbacteria bacterium]|nr:amino acid ABC transporter substrate-binding protein [Candidatus Taylorbacteria bacterium]